MSDNLQERKTPMSSNFSKIAKVAATAIRALNARNRELAAKNAKDSEKLATLEKEGECRKLAMEMADRGQIDRSFESVEKATKGLLEKDLAVVKEAMLLATTGISLGQPASTEPRDEVDPITKVLLESI